MAKEWNSRLEEATRYLEKAACKMKKWFDQRRDISNFKVGDRILFKVMPTQFRSQRKMHKVWSRRMKARSSLCVKVGKVFFKLKLPPSTRLHPVFHQNMHKPYRGDSGGVATISSSRSPMIDTPSVGREIVEIFYYQTGYPPKAKPYYEY